jgi:hypothetical protein
VTAPIDVMAVTVCSNGRISAGLEGHTGYLVGEGGAEGPEEGSNRPIKMAIIPPETCSSWSSVSSPVGSRTCSLVALVLIVVAMSFSIC